MAGTVQQWIDHLRSVAGQADASSVRIPDMGLDEPFRRSVIAPSAGAAPGGLPMSDIRLWWARVDSGLDVEGVLSLRDDGPLLPSDLYSAIEVWTDAELSALHALWALARERGVSTWQVRTEEALAWHLEHTQPDNATNRPWALHVFVSDGRPECQHYAETLLHNCFATSGVPDPFSGWILRDSVRLLEQFGA